MLEKLMNSFKKGKPKKSNEDEDDSSEHSEESSEDSHDSSDNAGDTVVADKKKNQMSMIIRVIVVICLAYLAVDQFLLKEKPQDVAQAPAAKTRKHKAGKDQPKDSKPVETKTAEAKPGDKAEAPPVLRDEVKPVANVDAKVEAKAEAKPEPKEVAKVEVPPVVAEEVKPEVKEEVKQEVKAEVKPIEKTANAEKIKTAPKETTPPVENINIADKKADEASLPKKDEKAVETSPKTGEVKSSEQVDKSIDSLIDSVDGKDKSVDEGSPKKSTKLEDKIVADDVYTAPPAYDQEGRGLVYNCKDKHWACVDKASYLNCNKNMKWNKSHRKPAECSVLNVYVSEDDCALVQKFNVTTAVATPFCN